MTEAEPNGSIELFNGEIELDLETCDKVYLGWHLDD